MFIKLIFQIAPILNTDGKLDCLEDKDKNKFQGTSFKDVMGLCFNHEIYFQMCKGLIYPDILEMISNQNVLTNCLVAPSMYIKYIWEQDSDYKFYFQQIFSNLHDTHTNSDNLFIPKDLQEFYDSNNIEFRSFSTTQK